MAYYAHSGEEKDKSGWHLLKTHLMETGDTAAGFAKSFGAEKLAFSAGLLHDLGKYSHDFQKRLEGHVIKVDHSTAGAVEAEKLYGPIGKLLAYVNHFFIFMEGKHDAQRTSRCTFSNKEGICCTLS